MGAGMTIWERALQVYQAKLAQDEADRIERENAWISDMIAFMVDWGVNPDGYDGLTILTTWSAEVDGEENFFAVLGYEDNPNGLVCRIKRSVDPGVPSEVEGVWHVVLTDGEWAQQSSDRIENITELGRIIYEMTGEGT